MVWENHLILELVCVFSITFIIKRRGKYREEVNSDSKNFLYKLWMWKLGLKKRLEVGIEKEIGSWG